MNVKKLKVEVNASHERAAIIGYWRNGATVIEIVSITGRFSYEIRAIISGYINSKIV